MALCIFVYVRFEAMDYSDSALQLLTQYLSAGSEWSLYYGRRMAESTGVLLSRIIISLIRGCLATRRPASAVRFDRELCMRHLSTTVVGPLR